MFNFAAYEATSEDTVEVLLTALEQLILAIKTKQPDIKKTEFFTGMLQFNFIKAGVDVYVFYLPTSGS